GVADVFPHAVIQWEDFHKRNAFRILENYRHRIRCFNDDIQGTAGVAVAGVLAALRITGQPITEQRVLFIGAGEACTGIARLLAAAMREAGSTEEEIKASRLIFDSRGLLQEGVEVTDDHKHELVASRAILGRYGLDGPGRPTPAEVIGRFQPTILVGATAMPGTFTREMIEEMAKHVDQPIVMPLSNPTSKAECAPREAIAWSGGRALVATGSPFPDVEHDGVRHVIGQGNNVFVFPGVGLGAIISEIQEINEEIFLMAARTLAEFVSDERLKQGALYPDQSELREVSARIAAAIVRYANSERLGRSVADEDVDGLVADSTWFPDYVPVISLDPGSN
ncbi:MAG: oxaloacetate-decarboxylating malate dehydrogenase, partial [Acidimicrobiia bacterium]|nr:oxaloacetate-decarboxylating malate dehydrogenase [Acidimicrobiia bacterium]